MGDHFCLKWNNHQENLTGIMTKLLDEQKFVDVSLVCEMKTFKAHQTVLSACSPYFEQVLEENPHPHPIIILRDVKEGEMAALLQYMYRGEVSVRDDELSAFLNTARALKVRGLSESKRESLEPQQKDDMCPKQYAPHSQGAGSPPKRPKLSGKGDEVEPSDKQLPNCSQPPTTPSLLKPSGVKSLGVTSVTPMLGHSENSNEVHYSIGSDRQPAIKQEVEPVSVSNEDQCEITQHQHLGNVESSNDEFHKVEDWSFEYGSNAENRSFQSQKAEVDCVGRRLASGSALTATFENARPTDVYDDCGSKQWQIKYAFEKVEGSGFKCKICGQIKKHVRNHYLKHFPEHHECHLCRRTYTRKDNLNSHLKRDHFRRTKSPHPAPCHRAKGPSGRPEPWTQGFKCLTPDVFGAVECGRGLGATGLGVRGPWPPVGSASRGSPGPVDLSLRPSSVPARGPCAAPIYDVLPSLYNYFRA